MDFYDTLETSFSGEPYFGNYVIENQEDYNDRVDLSSLFSTLCENEYD